MPAPSMSIESMPVLLSPILPFTAGWSLLGRGLFGSFLDLSTLPSASQRLVWGFPQPPELALYVARLVCSSFGSVGPCSVPHGLCALQRFVCMPLLAPSTHPLHCWASVGFSQFPKPAVWSGPQYVSCLWAEKCSFLCFMLSGSLLYPAEIPQLPLGYPLWGSFPVHGNSSFFMTPSLPRGTSFHTEVFSLYMSPSSLLPHFRELSHTPWRPGIFCCLLEVAL